MAFDAPSLDSYSEMSKSIKFNAGRVEFDELNVLCKPEPQKGIITIKPLQEDSDFFSLLWTPKESTSIEIEELLLIPGDVAFKKVSLCSTGRVLSLSFMLSLAKHFFWLQDVGDLDDPLIWTSKDLSLLKQLNDIVDLEDEVDLEREKDTFNHGGNDDSGTPPNNDSNSRVNSGHENPTSHKLKSETGYSSTQNIPTSNSASLTNPTDTNPQSNVMGIDYSDQ